MSTTPFPAENATTRNSNSNETWLDLVQRQVSALNFGSVHITVHEGRVVQVETSVRVRLDKAP